MTLRLYTPLCPAGHLPLKGGDWLSHRLSPIFSVAEWAATSRLPISPLEGERPEGGGLARRWFVGAP
ncbi:MAG: lytic murein transglycosylase [Mesorhizobium sp.]|nr:MAG: lytic murein transglycosylase [Mesorhizobium sp.]RWO12336.1 MAG: lytic murein transglycosylase [Mesorhizobium sp.]RWO20912.1 MAG: lytic murein transglycosylase [Mesorhizobium sp.]RWP27587.1 MAG: lytic murein transglycosylase [Mesorhizobium sp.]RWP58834.1 MAG: lytic murein transglycosylase [Mesorhizobium sp.]